MYHKKALCNKHNDSCFVCFTGIISNETTYKELTDDDQLSGLDVTLDDYIDNMKNDYYRRDLGKNRRKEIRLCNKKCFSANFVCRNVAQSEKICYNVGVEYVDYFLCVFVAEISISEISGMFGFFMF